MSTTKKLVGVYQRNSKTGTYMFYPEATEKSGFPLSTLVLHGSGEHKEVFTQADIDAAVRLTLKRVRNMNAAGAAIAELISKEHNIPL